MNSQRTIPVSTHGISKTYSNSMQRPILILRIVGFWAEYGSNRSWWDSLYLVYHVAAVIAYILLTLSLSIGFCYNFDTLQNITDYFSVLIVTICNGMKVFPFVFLRSKVEKCMKMLEDELFPLGIETDEKTIIISTAKKSMKKYLTVYCSLFACTVASWLSTTGVEILISKWTSNSNETVIRSLPFPGWFPYDTTVTPNWELSYLFQCFATFIDGGIACSSDCFYFILIFHACNQFKILSVSLQNVREIAIERLQAKQHLTVQNVPINEREIDAEMNSCLVQSIKHHQAILRFVEEVNDIISPIMLVDCLVLCLLICTIAFYATTLSPMSLKFVSMIGFLMCEMTQLLLYCWFSTELMWNSRMVQDAAYSSEWYSSTPDFKKSVRIVMMRATKPARIKALNFSTVSLQLFVALLKNSYSFFALLRQLHTSER